MISNIISEDYLAKLDQQRAITLGIKAERDELLQALKALYKEARAIDAPTVDMIAALWAARLAILRAEERQ